MDSYQKFAESVISKKSKCFQLVKDNDLDEVHVAFALMISSLEYCDNFRIFPLEMGDEFYEVAEKGCCGSVNSQVKCLSKNIYWVGCNYGH